MITVVGRTIILVTLLIVAYTQTFIRLSTAETWKTLKVNDSITSTLGRFKATLIKDKCRLNITQFNQTNNQRFIIAFFTPPDYNSKDCNNLTIRDGQLVTQTNETYIKVIGPNFNASTVFTIDDEGILRLIGTYSSRVKSNLVSIQLKYGLFQRPQKWTKSFYQLLITEFDDFGSINNTRNWTFSVHVNQLTMYNLNNPSLRRAYTFPRLNISNTIVYDFNTQTFPAALFGNITYHPRCFQPKQYLNYKAPYVFELDPYWPIVNFYEQGGYRIAQIAYGQLSEFDFMQGKKYNTYYNYYSPCPPKTFQYKGQCVAKCPQPYFHEMRGEIGKCVLVCENYTPINKITRICSCSLSHQSTKFTTQIIHKCPQKGQSVPYGCLCSNNTYFDSKYSLNCVKECPSGTYAANGICMSCPIQCLQCERDELYRNYLKCTKCQIGFIVQRNGAQCVKGCINNHGMSLINGQCITCVDKNCIDCPNDSNKCERCGLFHSLYQQKCSFNCQYKEIAVYTGNMSSICMSKGSNCNGTFAMNYKGKGYLRCSSCQSGYIHLSGCVQSCPSGFLLKQNKICVCAKEGEILVDNTCKILPGCPKDTFFDYNRTFSCIACPFGCLSCFENACTGCYPGYHLFISPKEVPQCLRNSPLYPCDGQYSLQRNSTCIVNQYQNFSSVFGLCLTNIKNCEICLVYSLKVCILCQKGYYMLNNTCISSCPKKMAPFVHVCILLEIQSCQISHLGVNRRYGVIKSLNALDQSQAYAQYIIKKSEFSSLQKNDPIGYIYYIQQFALYKPNGLQRHTNFYEPQQRCLKCENGKGLNHNLTLCVPCPGNCKRCYLALEQSCLDALDTGNNTQPIDKNCGLSFYDTATKECVESCTDPGKFPEFEDDGSLSCKPSTQSLKKDYIKIDATSYEFQGTPVKMSYFVFDRSVKQQEISIIRANKKVVEARLSQSSNETDANETNANETKAFIQDGCFIQLQGDFDIYILNFSGSILEIRSNTQTSNSGLTSKTYGFFASNSFKKTMQAWLAYIGYVMSITILCLHFVFIGNELLYKMDNLIIFIQSIYFFLYTKNLVGKLLAQFYYGWSYMHAMFLPNLFSGIIPNLYREKDAPCSYKLVNLDGNYFRNAGYSLVWMMIYLVCFGVVVFILWIIRKLGRKNQIWYKQIAMQALMAGVQFFSFNLLFFSMTQLRYSGDSYEQDQSYYNRSQALAIVTLIGYTIYTIMRLIYYPAGGVYMVKRIFLAASLFASYQNPIFLVPVLLLELIFAIVRFYLQSPQSGWEIFFIFLQAFIFIGGYLLLFLCVDTGVNSIILSIVIFLLVVYLAYDLTTLYLEYKNQYSMKALQVNYEDQKKLAIRRKPKFSEKMAHQSKSSVYESYGRRSNYS